MSTKRTSDTTQSQVTLDSFTTPLKNTTLPDRDYAWADETFTRGPATCVAPNNPDSDFISLGGDASIRASEAGFILTGADDYRSTYGRDTVDIPSYYSRFSEEFTPELSYYTAASRGVGFGMNARRLEETIRFATGGGRFSTDDITVTLCGRHPVLIESADGAFLITPAEISTVPDGFDIPTYSVSGVEVGEELESVRDGMELFLSALDSYFGLSIESWDCAQNGSHVFTTQDGRKLKIYANDLRRLIGMTRRFESVRGKFEFESEFGEQFCSEWDVCRWRVGEQVENRYGRKEMECVSDEQRTMVENSLWVGEEVCVGYRRVFDDPRTSSRASLSGRVKACEGYVLVGVEESGDDVRASVDVHTQKIESFKPETEEYDPSSV